MHDGISLEALGVPTAVIVTSTFLHEARMQREALGMAGIVPVVIEHPLSSISDEEIRGRAAQALAQVIGVWQGRQPDPS
ncbi:MAG TPA: hypothetical protein VJ789_07810 [Burkholderiales bacterium]|nr:hypothetical protein [Burkholderiales bacterium]